MNLKLKFIPVLALMMIIYFSYHTVQGNRGWRRMTQLQAERILAKEKSQELEEERRMWQTKVNALSGRYLDLDQLEESSFRVLNYVHPEDRVIFEEEK